MLTHVKALCGRNSLLYITFTRKMSSGRKVFVLGAARTPVGSFRKSLSPLAATKLGSIAIEAAVKRSGLQPNDVEEVYMGQVMQAASGQAPARQAALGAGLAESVPCTTINKVCASGMKAIMQATQSILCGDNDIMVAGGMESMSNVPFAVRRGELPYGGASMLDLIVLDGLTDVYNNFHMGLCGENTAKNHNITREEQDSFAIQSYERARSSLEQLSEEIVSVTIPQRNRDALVISQDEEPQNFRPEKFSKLRPAFDKNGGITAGNASKLNDGAAACVLSSNQVVEQRGLKPLAEILGYADAAMTPIDFPIAPVEAVKKLLKRQNMNVQDVDLWELNEAFSVVGLACSKLLNLDSSKVNVDGGAVSIGHPLGMSGARITNHLVYRLKKGEIGVAAICNGGGGASAIMIKKL